MRSRRSFTLMELLVAVTIMGALVLMAQGTYVIYMRDSLEATLRQNLFMFRSAIQQFYADHGRYPFDQRDHLGNSLGLLDTNTSELTMGVRVCQQGSGGCTDPYPEERVRYLMEIPIDPTTNQINWMLLPHDNDGDWRAFADEGKQADPNDFQFGEGNGIWDLWSDTADDHERLLDDRGDPTTANPGLATSDARLKSRFGIGDGKPTRGEAGVDEDWFDNLDNDGDGEKDEDPFDVRDVVSANRDYWHL